jgi:hypothetical protein
MPLVPTIPVDAVAAARWREDEQRARWEAAAAEIRRAEKIEQLRARVHKLDMRLAGLQSRDRWRRIERRHWELNGPDERTPVSWRRYQDEAPTGGRRSSGPEPGHGTEARFAGPVEHSAPVGWVLGVR